MAYYTLRVEHPVLLTPIDPRFKRKTVVPGTTLGLHLTGNVSILNADPEVIYSVGDNVPELVAAGKLTVFKCEKAPLPRFPNATKKDGE